MDIDKFTFHRLHKTSAEEWTAIARGNAMKIYFIFTYKLQSIIFIYSSYLFRLRGSERNTPSNATGLLNINCIFNYIPMPNSSRNYQRFKSSPETNSHKPLKLIKTRQHWFNQTNNILQNYVKNIIYWWKLVLWEYSWTSYWPHSFLFITWKNDLVNEFIQCTSQYLWLYFE